MCSRFVPLPPPLPPRAGIQGLGPRFSQAHKEAHSAVQEAACGRSQTPRGSGFAAGSGTPGLPGAQTSPSLLPSSVLLSADLPRAGGGHRFHPLGTTARLAAMAHRLPGVPTGNPGQVFLSEARLLAPPFSITGGKEEAGARGISAGGERGKDLEREDSRSRSGRTRDWSVRASSGNNRGLAEGSALRSRWAPFRIPATRSFTRQTLTEQLCVCRPGVEMRSVCLPLPLAGSPSPGRMRSE